MAQDKSGARDARTLMEAVAEVAPDLEARRAASERPAATKASAPPPLPGDKAKLVAPSLAPLPPLPLLPAASASATVQTAASAAVAKPVTLAPVQGPPIATQTPPTQRATPPSAAAAVSNISAPPIAPTLLAKPQSTRPETVAPVPTTVGAAIEMPAKAPGSVSPAELEPAVRRRPAGPSRATLAANDDVPTIGGLIFALQQKPSQRPFVVAAALSGLWLAIGGFFAWAMLAPEIAKAAGFGELLARPALLITIATIVLPIAVFWFLAWLLYQAEDLRLRTSAMTEVAIRLAEPDKNAENAVASLGQTVRKQVGYMNEAISQAIGRAGELEAMVHNEVASLEQSFAGNEARIRGLLNELASERNQLTGTSEQVHTTLRSIGDEVPALIEKLNSQQLKLSRIIENAGQNLIALEGSLTKATGQLEGSISDRTAALKSVLTETTAQLENTFTENSGQVQTMMVDRTTHLQTVLDEYTSALHASLGTRTGQLQSVFEDFTLAIDSTLAVRSETINTTMIGHVQALDSSMIERTQALDAAFASRLQILDQSIQNSTLAIDGAVGEKARALTAAMETHAKQLAETLGRQSQNLDETLIQGINAVRRTSENITRQSVKAIEGLSSQADMLKNVSENLLGQIGTVTTRFENQGQSIMRAANSLEAANHRIDQTLQSRHRELTNTLGQVTESTDQLGQQMLTYKATIEGSLSEASLRAKAVTEELTRGAQSHAQQALGELQRLRVDTDQQAGHALNSLREQVSSVSREMTDHVGSLSSRLSQTSDELRARSRTAQQELEREQELLRLQAQKLPDATRESVEGMRRVLAEQMRALDQVSHIANRERGHYDISPPATGPGSPNHTIPQPRPAIAPPPASGAPSLASALAEQMQRAAAAQPSAANGWSLGDLLARASKDEQPAATPEPVAASPTAVGQGGVNLEQIASALDAQTAGAIWARFRSGQRGILVRSIYSAEGRAVFDDMARRYQTDMGFRAMIDRFLADFEHELRDIEAKDRTGQLLQHHLVSGSGRVYLFLSHASGRMS